MIISPRPRLSNLLTLIFSGLLFFTSYGQQRCATVEYEKKRKTLNPKLEDEKTFEKWLKDKSSLRTQGTQRTQSVSYKIPIVVHVIHNGEPIGTGTNISDAQIFSQITVLNEDFRRLNADASLTPNEFLGVAGSIDIEFVMAKQDPNASGTNGINRVKGNKTSWTFLDNAQFKALSYWPAENYLNIWVLNLTDFLGYAQFPISSLPGLENSPTDRLTDGIAIAYRDFGRGAFDLEPRYNLGRTTTHEIGHFFGLRHVWGDQSSCTDSDFVTDTPPQSSSTTTCPSHPQLQCSSNKMFQNFLDYTDDACMNLFTLGQISRMTTVLNNSVRRLSLLTSPGLVEPIVNDDLGIKEIIAPALTSCGPETPTLNVSNDGANIITSARIRVKLNGVIQETKDFTLNLNKLETAAVSFNSINLTEAATDNVSFEILETNGVTDAKASNNFRDVVVKVAAKANLPISTSFNTFPSNWSLENPDASLTWQVIPAANGTPGNKAIHINLRSYENLGTVDRIVTPLFNLSGFSNVTLKFDRAYAESIGDQLKVLVSSSCNYEGPVTEIFNKSGAALATAPATGSSFVPINASQWATEVISLNQFAGQAQVQIAFVVVNGNGNNLFLDNISVTIGDFTDITLLSLESPSVVSCQSNSTPIIRVKNSGSVVINSFKVQASANNGPVTSQTFTDTGLIIGEERSFTLNSMSLKSGDNDLSFTLADPNGIADILPTDNNIKVTRVINSSTDLIPLRQNFNGPLSPWTIFSKDEESKWISTATNKSTSLVYEAFSNPNKGETSWLVSPTLDFSRTLKASMFYEISHATRDGFANNDRLQVLASTDCGVSFDNVLVDQKGDQLAVKETSGIWSPKSATDWKRLYLNLDPLVGQKDARLAFVVTNDNGNNLYLDDIEFFIDDNPNPLAITQLYTVYNSPLDFKITFNLPERENVRLQIYNTLGQEVIDNILPETLNQTYQVDMTNQTSGLYIVRMQIGNQLTATKVFLSH